MAASVLDECDVDDLLAKIRVLLGSRTGDPLVALIRETKAENRRMAWALRSIADGDPAQINPTIRRVARDALAPKEPKE
jgi:hypothetical protein